MHRKGSLSITWGHSFMWQGFPRADIDIPAVRSDRQRLSGDFFLHLLCVLCMLNSRSIFFTWLNLRSGCNTGIFTISRGFCAALRNDHKEITDAIEKNLIILHSGGFTSVSSQPDRRTGVLVHPNLCPYGNQSDRSAAKVHQSRDGIDSISCRLQQRCPVDLGHTKYYSFHWKTTERSLQLHWETCASYTPVCPCCKEHSSCEVSDWQYLNRFCRSP